MEDLAKFFIIAWGLWSRRNKYIYENINIPPQAAIEKGLSILLLDKDCNDLQGSIKKNIPGRMFEA